jgi:hypothetical protein
MALRKACIAIATGDASTIIRRITLDVRRRGDCAMGRVRTTITLPADLVDAADQAVRAGKARSRNDLLIMALRRELTAQRRAEIDANLASMADDPELQAEAEQIEREFARADDEAGRIAASES